jgi:5-methylcytosine-specific restriction endonuclease McrA
MNKPGTRRNGHRTAQDRARLKRKRLPCYICGQPIDYDAGPLDPHAFQLDHILPRSTHPDLEHDPSNHGASHRACNRAKSDGPINGTKTVPTSRSWL